MPARTSLIWTALCVPLLVATGMSPGRAARADLVWENYYADEQSIVDGTVLSTPSGIDVAIDRLVYSDSDGGTFDLGLYDNADFLTFEAGQLGGHFGLLEASFNNQNNDPADFLELVLTFSAAVTNLQFSLLDVDSGSWDDGIEVFYNGSLNARDNPAFYALGSTNGLDNESYMHGFEGYGSSAAGSGTQGNIDFDFGQTAITTLRIRYFSTDDADSNPGGQRVGLSDLSFGTTVNEPPALAMVGLFAIIALRVVRRDRRDAPVRRRPGLLAD